MKHTWILAVTAAAVATACNSNGNEEYVARLREAQAQSQVSLRDTIAIAKADTQSASGVSARLHVEAEPVFAVGAIEAATLFKIRIDLNGTILSTQSIDASNGLCPGSVSLEEALAIAEVEAGGEAVAVEPDDDVACALEVQVLTPNTLWEVKVGQGGNILESEESDENGEPDED